MPDDFPLEPVSYGAFFFEQPSDLSECSACSDQIFGKMYTLQTQVTDATNTAFSDMPVKLCQSCYELQMGRYNGPENI